MPTEKIFDPAKTLKYIVRVFEQHLNLRKKDLKYEQPFDPEKNLANALIDITQSESFPPTYSGADISNAEVPSLLLGDEARLIQIVLNLCKNALIESSCKSVRLSTSYDRRSELLKVEVHCEGMMLTSDQV